MIIRMKTNFYGVFSVCHYVLHSLFNLHFFFNWKRIDVMISKLKFSACSLALPPSNTQVGVSAMYLKYILYIYFFIKRHPYKQLHDYII